MKDMKLSNIQKESEKIKIKKCINEYEDLKARALLNLGIIVFDKIRKNEIQNNDFNELCEEIKNYDIEIYTKYMELKSIEKDNSKIICECGYRAFKNEKFCPQCGKSLEKEQTQYITCPNCNQQTEEDSNFCSCCGSKIEKVKEEISDEQILNNYISSDEDVEEEIFIENEGREFLKNQEDNII